MSNGEQVQKTDRTTMRRFPDRGSYETTVINAILDEALVCCVAFEHDGQPALLPMAFWRTGEHVYFHGSARNRMFLDLIAGGRCCFMTHTIDALVLARAALHHSVNYRSVVIYGVPEEVAGEGAKLAALEAFVTKVYPGRWAEIRQPSESELKAARVFRLPVTEASAKIRAESPTYYRDDLHIPVWAGLVPVKLSLGTPIADEHVPATIATPEHATHLGRVWESARVGRVVAHSSAPASNADY